MTENALLASISPRMQPRWAGMWHGHAKQREQLMRASHFFAWVWYGRGQRLAVGLCLVFFLAVAPARADAPLTLLVPSRQIVSQPDIPDRDSASQATGERTAGRTTAKTRGPDAEPEKRAMPEEVDVLLSMMRPFLHAGVAVDMPQLFAVLRHDADPAAPQGGAQPERRDLLGDVEEIRYLDQKAWGANVALDTPGLYQFILEGRPWWDEERQTFLRHQVKVTLPVHGVERGWDEPAGQSFEIQPLSRPFGLRAPALFSGRILLDGKPLAGTSVRMVRINADGATAPTQWHEDLAGVSNAAGEVAFVLAQPGWWCCEALTAGEPLKGPDGELKPVERGALFWFFVESADPSPGDGRKR